MEEIRKEDKMKWFLILQHLHLIENDQLYVESKDPTIQLICQLGNIHNGTLLRMIMPFM